MDAVCSIENLLVTLPGGVDKEKRPLILINVPQDNRNTVNVVPRLQYVLQIFSNSTKQKGFTILFDGRKSSWKLTKTCIKQINDTLSSSITRQLIVIKPDGFWDIQMENCTWSNKESEAIFITKSRLNKFVDQSQLPVSLGGNLIYDHVKWMENRQKIDEFYKDADATFKELDELYHQVVTNKTVNTNVVEENAIAGFEMIEAIKMLVYNVTETGKELVQNIEDENRTRKLMIDNNIYTPQDTIDTIEQIHKTINNIRQVQQHVEAAWFETEACSMDNKDLTILKDGVVRVINWILGPAEKILNEHQKVGYDLTSAEELRREHEAIEFECWQTYGIYAELLYKINCLNLNSSLTKSDNNQFNITLQQKDLVSQKEFMDFICKSFALRLERRRNVLITSLRFFRLVSDYFDKTEKIFDSLIVKHDNSNPKQVAEKLNKLQVSQKYLESLQLEIQKEGDKLSDLLSMPVNNSLGQEIEVDYSEDIANIHDIVDATIARRNIFNDNVNNQKMLFQQINLIELYEENVTQSIKWLEDILKVMMREHAHIGITITEIQSQKKEHQTYQDITNEAYNYGCQLLNALFLLKQSCKLSLENHDEMCYLLKHYWKRIIAISQEQLARLRVSTVFYRSVESHTNQLRNMRETVATIPSININDKKARLEECFIKRENLMIEVGRIVRLGRLLRNRLKEPIYEINSSDSPSVLSPTISLKLNFINDEEFQKLCEIAIRNNEIIIESITEHLSEVIQLAEELDQVLETVRKDCIVFSIDSKLTVDMNNNDINEHPNKMNELLEGTNKSVKKSENPQQRSTDEELLNVSSSTLRQSRSFPFNASDSIFTSRQNGKDNLKLQNTEQMKTVPTVECLQNDGLSDVNNNLKAYPELPSVENSINEMAEIGNIKFQQQ